MLEISSTTSNLDNAALALPNKKSPPIIENLFPNAEGADGFIDDVIVRGVSGRDVSGWARLGAMWRLGGVLWARGVLEVGSGD